MGSKIGFEMSFIIVEAIRGRCASFGDIWWTDNPIYFSSIDMRISSSTHLSHFEPFYPSFLDFSAGIFFNIFTSKSLSMG